MFNSSDFGTFQLSFISESTYTQKSKAVETDLVSPAALKHVCLFVFQKKKKMLGGYYHPTPTQSPNPRNILFITKMLFVITS